MALSLPAGVRVNGARRVGTAGGGKAAVIATKVPTRFLAPATALAIATSMSQIGSKNWRARTLPSTWGTPPLASIPTADVSRLYVFTPADATAGPDVRICGGQCGGWL